PARRPLNADVRVLAAAVVKGRPDYFPLAGLVGEAVADAELHWQGAGRGRGGGGGGRGGEGGVRCLLFLGARARPGLVEPARAPNLAAAPPRPPELDPDLRPRPRAPARMLITRRTHCWTGRSAGLAPLRTFPA